jgi:hypothetical protein
MPTLTRRRDQDCRDRWMIYFGDVRVGDIASSWSSDEPRSMGLVLRL